MSRIIFHNTDVRVGFHITKEPTFVGTFTRIIHDSPVLRSYQIYVGNRSGYGLPNFDVDDILESRRLLEEHDKYLCIHGCLTYNLAGSTVSRADPDFDVKVSKIRTKLLAELDIGVGLNCGVVVHIGSCKNRVEGIENICSTIEYVLTAETSNSYILAEELGISVKDVCRRRRVILENAAGEGTKIGSTLEEIAQVISGIDRRLQKQVRVCIDTAHAFGAGQYNFGDPEQVDQFYEDFDQHIGLKFLEVFHLNDSRVPFGSKKDRHENLCIGHMFGGNGRAGLLRFLEIAEERRIPLIGEPPSKTSNGNVGPGGYADLDTIRNLYPRIEKVVD